MINLLSTEEKRALQAAKTNVLLVRYNIALLGVVGFVVIAFGFTDVMLNISQNDAKNIIASNKAKVASYDPTRKKAEAFSKNLGIAKQIFAKDIDYTGLITGIANTMPAGTVLQQLNLGPSTIGKPSTLNAAAISTDKALELKDALAANTKLFSNVSLVSITGGGTSKGYSYSVVLNVTINNGAV